MRLASPVFSADGTVLLARGVRVKPSFVERLRSLGFQSVYVEEPGFEDVTFPELISTSTRQEAMALLRETFLRAQSRHAIDMRVVSALARGIVEEVLSEREIVIHLGDIRGHDDYTFSHSVNVSVLCVLIGRGLGYTPAAMRDLAVGGLLHDLGKVFIPESILNKKGPLTEEEMELVRAHPRCGFDILRTNPGISLLSAHMAYQHHEMMDGSGYPRGLKGDQIHPYARVNAVADAFDAMTSDRPYRKGASPLKALEVLGNGAARRYDPKVVAVLRSYVAPYPVGSRVLLNTGDWAVVVSVRRKALDRPKVRLVTAEGNPLSPPLPEVDLSEHPQLSIVQTEE